MEELIRYLEECIEYETKRNNDTSLSERELYAATIKKMVYRKILKFIKEGVFDE